MSEAKPEVALALAELCNWAAQLRWEQLPEDIRRRAGLVLIDDFAALVAARDEPELRSMRERLAAFSGPAESWVHDGSGRRVDRYSAALGNGSAADWCELDGGYRLAVCHAALYCIPALLAEAEATGRTLREVLVALVAGYEVVARTARCFAFPRLTMHPHGGLATIGAAAAIARLRGVDGKAMLAAVNSGAALVVPGPFNHAVEGALMRNLWPGICAQNGIRAVDWVAMGIGGGPNALYEVFAGIMSATADAGALDRELGGTFAIRDGYHKLFACCQYSHSTVEAVLEALQQAGHAVRAADVRRIEVLTHAKGRMLDNARPATTLAAKFSIQHIAAATLAFGHAGAEAFAATTLGDPVLDELRHKVAIGAFAPDLPPPNDRPARVAIELADGRVLRGECLSARGGSDRPFDRAQMLEKARGNLEAAYRGLSRQVEAVADAAEELLPTPLASLFAAG